MTNTESQRIPLISRRRGVAKYFIEQLPQEVPLEMVLIPAGKFMMGAPEDEEDSKEDERPQHEVTIQEFCLGKYPITQRQYECVMGTNPSYFKNKSDSGDRPVEKVNWNEAVEFCERLSKHTGREYRLPSEAEWEYACRAGTTTPYHFGETITPELVNYNGNHPYGGAPKGDSRKETTVVGSLKAANAFGLYDMHGNVWEWCADDWHYYKEAPTDGSAWIKPDGSGSKCLRGGSWYSNARYCRSAFRYRSDAHIQVDLIGFRVVCLLR